jgi:hypothetical protein
MIRTAAIVIFSVMIPAGIMVGCKNNSNPAAPVGQRTVIFSDGFESPVIDTSIWRLTYMVNFPDFYPQMRITTDAAHTGARSLTSDSNRTALVYETPPKARIETGIAGAEFYIMAKAAGQINFTVEIGQYKGSSGGLGKAFGFGFDRTDSLKCTYFNDHVGQNDSMLSSIQLNHWYKCVVEVDFIDTTVTYYLDDAKVRALPLPTLDQEMMGIDRFLVFRGMGLVDLPNAEGPKPYFADDIVFYKK